jgi:peptide deformylase
LAIELFFGIIHIEGDSMLLMKDIIQDGHPLLRKRAVDVKIPLEKVDLDTIRSMMEFVKNSQDPDQIEKYKLRPSVGLAAPQIAISKKMFCVHTWDETGNNLASFAFVNPKIISFSEELTYLPGGEGCLSVDENTTGLVPRSKRIKLKAHLVDLETGVASPVLMKLSGYVGIVVQHEYDHLLGTLFIDKVKPSLPNLKPIIFNEEVEERTA